MSPTPYSLKKASSQKPVTGASILAIREGKAVIVKRGREPSRGLWALPGGRQELGETLEETARRELAEETGLSAGSLNLLQLIEPIRRDDAGAIISHYVLGVFVTRDVSGTLMAGDDAADARWAGRDELANFEFTGTSLEILLAELD